jgi:hypothetical protein
MGIQAEKRERALVLETNRMTDKLDALLTPRASPEAQSRLQNALAVLG